MVCYATPQRGVKPSIIVKYPLYDMDKKSSLVYVDPLLNVFELQHRKKKFSSYRIITVVFVFN